jgi:hypothetical protein
MSELSTARSEKQDVVKQPQPVVEQPEPVIEAVSQPPVVITAQEVAFSTAAAVSLPRAKPAHGVIAALRALFLSPPEDARPVPRHYPPRRDEFLEDAAMRREMYRL